MRVEVDVSAVHERTEYARALLTNVEHRMLAIANVACDEEVATHEYDNYTGDLEESTFARIAEPGVVEAGARMFYGPIVESRGRMAMEPKLIEAGESIQEMFDEDAATLSG